MQQEAAVKKVLSKMCYHLIKPTFVEGFSRQMTTQIISLRLNRLSIQYISARFGRIKANCEVVSFNN